MEKLEDESWFSKPALTSSSINTMLVIFFLMSPTTSSFGFQRSSYKQLFFIDIKCFFSRTSRLQQHWQLRWMQFSTPTDKIISTSTRSPNRLTSAPSASARRTRRSFPLLVIKTQKILLLRYPDSPGRTLSRSFRKTTPLQSICFRANRLGVYSCGTCRR